MSKAGGGRLIRGLALLLFLALLGALFALGVGILVSPSEGVLDVPFSHDKVALVRMEGMIAESDEVIRQLRKWAKDDSVRAIVMRIDSPGGAVTPSQEIFTEIRKANRQKPVVASMGTLAASGGYYIASACRRIVASPGTITGSIGVIVMFSNFEKLMDKIGLGSVALTSGKFKDTGSPYRPFTEEDRRVMQGIVDNIYEQFVKDVAEMRKMDIETVRKLADGRIYTGAQAMENKLIDRLGNLQDTILLAAGMAGVVGEPKVVEDEKGQGLLRWLMGEEMAESLANALSFKSGVYFMWPAGR